MLIDKLFIQNKIDITNKIKNNNYDCRFDTKYFAYDFIINSLDSSSTNVSFFFNDVLYF